MAMASGITSFERRIEIMFYIIRERKTNLSALSETFNVSKRTISDDISLLSHYIPIYSQSGGKGGIYLIDNYHCELFRYLSDRQEKLLAKVLELVDEDDKHEINGIINQFAKPKT